MRREFQETCSRHYFRLVGKPQVILGPYSTSQLAPSPMKSSRNVGNCDYRALCQNTCFDTDKITLNGLYLFCELAILFPKPSTQET